MKNYVHFSFDLFFLIAIFFLPAKSIAQKTKIDRDTIQARVLLKEALLHQDSSEFGMAAVKSHEAALLTSKALKGDSRLLADALCLEGRAQSNSGNLDTAFILLQKALTIRLKILGPKHPEVADAIVNLGECFVMAIQNDSAIYYLKKGLEIQELNTESHPDIARTLNALGLALVGIKDYSQAMSYFRSALVIHRENDKLETKDLAATYGNIGHCLLATGRYQSAIDTLEVTKNLFLKLSGNEEDPSLIITYINLGVANRVLSNNQVAKVYFQKAKLALSNTNPIDSITLATICFTLAQVNNETGDFELAVENYHKAKGIWENKLGKLSSRVGLTLSDMGLCYLAQGKIDSAIGYENLALNLYAKTEGISSFNTAVVLTNLGVCAEGKSDFDLAIQYYYKALDNLLKFKDPNWGYIASIYSNLGSAYTKKGLQKDYQKAAQFFIKGLELNRMVYGEKHPNTALTYNNLGSLFFKQNINDTAILFFNTSKNIYTSFFPNGDRRIAVINCNIAQCYQAREELDSSEIACKLALSFWDKQQVRNTEQIAVAQAEMGNIYRMRNKFEEAENWYLKSRKSIGYLNSYEFDKCASMGSLLNILGNQGQSYLNWYNKSKKKIALEKAFQIFLEVDSAFHYQSKKLTEPGSQETLAKNVDWIYEKAISTCMDMAVVQQEKKYNEKAFYFSEFSKAKTLQSAIQTSNALRFSEIPLEIIELEKNLKLKITELEKRRPILERQILQTKDSLSLDKLNEAIYSIEAKMYELNRTVDSLQKVLELKYPKYYGLKYDVKTISVKQVQNTVLEANQTAIEYYIGDSSIFLFIIKMDDYRVLEVRKDFPLKDWVEQIRSSIEISGRKDTTDIAILRARENYAIISSKLYQKLVAPAVQMLTENLIVIPDGELNYLPFETLLIHTPKQTNNFKSFHYMVEKYAISYAPSFTFLNEMKEKKHWQEPDSTLLALAPFSDSLSYSVVDNLLTGIVRGEGIKRLNYSGEEIGIISKLAQGRAVYNLSATSKFFKMNANKYRILHLSQHAKADKNVGDYSYLMFSDTLLYVRDIYNLQLNSDMVVLSACETGYGELRRGEGMIGMARAFEYAGTKSLFATLWEVNDEATRNLTVNFYTRLLNKEKSMTKDQALREAKLVLIKNGGDFAHPYYWAGMIGIGDMRPVKLGYQ